MLWRSKIHINLKIDAGVVVSAVKYILTIKGREGRILLSSNAFTVYAVSRIKSKTKQILPTVIPT
jgi:hypothetical protein